MCRNPFGKKLLFLRAQGKSLGRSNAEVPTLITKSTKDRSYLNRLIMNALLPEMIERVNFRH